MGSRLFTTYQKGQEMVAQQLSGLFSRDAVYARSLAQRIADLNMALAELPYTDQIELAAEFQSATNELVRLFEEWAEVRRERVALFGG
jgi:hypothetical protein